MGLSYVSMSWYNIESNISADLWHPEADQGTLDNLGRIAHMVTSLTFRLSVNFHIYKKISMHRSFLYLVLRSFFTTLRYFIKSLYLDLRKINPLCNRKSSKGVIHFNVFCTLLCVMKNAEHSLPVLLAETLN